jgi:lipopolysaccharide/colanic/teichoic acid biosynthesis glycosyltransferase
MQTPAETTETLNCVVNTSFGAPASSSVRAGTICHQQVEDSITGSLLNLSHSVNLAQHQNQNLGSQRLASDGLDQFVKRTVDFVMASIILAALLPLLIIVAALVFITSPGPIFFKHRRVGQHGQEFLMWKFRTMCLFPDKALNLYFERCPEAKAEWLRNQKLANDPRVTKLGRILRRFSIDELPQLWNVVKGDMSLIGPRPIVKGEIPRYGGAISAYYAVRPGLTGLWQVSGRSNTTYVERIRLDQQYVEQWSPTLDASILLKTFRVLITAEGAY